MADPMDKTRHADDATLAYIEQLESQLAAAKKEKTAMTDKTQTPRTDAMARDRYDSTETEFLGQAVDADFARQLEMELSAANARLAGIVEATNNSRLFSMFMQQGFWHAHHVDLMWRYNGEDVREEADWLKTVWYQLRALAPQSEQQADGVVVPKIVTDKMREVAENWFKTRPHIYVQELWDALLAAAKEPKK